MDLLVSEMYIKFDDKIDSVISKQPIKQPLKCKIMLSGIPKQWDHHDLFQALNKYGKITRCLVRKNWDM